jgi:hypothetical protein
VAHRDTVAYGDRVELHGDAAGLLDALFEERADLVEMAVTGNETLVAVADSDEGLFHVAALHSRSEQKTSVGCAFIALFDLIGCHRDIPFNDFF